MIKSGHQLSDAELARRYSAIAARIDMPGYFHPLAARLADPRPGERALDVGCGNGGMLENLARRCPEAELFGAELSAELVARAGRRLRSTARIINAHAGRLPFAAGSFDLLTMTELLEHLKEPESVLRELRRVVREQGRLLLTFPNGTPYRAFIPWAERLAHPLARVFLPPEHPRNSFQPIDTVYFYPEVEALLRHSGWRIERSVGREALRILYGLAQASPWPHRLCPPAYRLSGWADRWLNRKGLARWCYRVLLLCRPT